jgi:hypothetical protein
MYTYIHILIIHTFIGAHLKQLEHDITPIGSHYLLVHFDVPVLHEDTHTVRIHGLVNKVCLVFNIYISYVCIFIYIHTYIYIYICI